MKKVLIMLVVSMFLFGSYVFAQVVVPAPVVPPVPVPGNPRAAMVAPEATRTIMLLSRVNLTDEQKAKAKEILDKAVAEVVEKVLTAEQRDQLKAAQAERGPGRGPGGAGGPGGIGRGPGGPDGGPRGTVPVEPNK